MEGDQRQVGTIEKDSIEEPAFYHGRKCREVRFDNGGMWAFGPSQYVPEACQKCQAVLGTADQIIAKAR